MDFPDGGIFLNASVLNLRYEMAHYPLQVEIKV